MKIRASRLYGRTYFTDGQTQEYERAMQSTPGFTNQPRSVKGRDCPHCLYWLVKEKKCSHPRCVVFE